MKLIAETGGKESSVEVRREGDTVFAVIEGREYELEVSEPEPGVFLFKHDGSVSEFFVSRGTDPSGPFNIKGPGRSYDIVLVDPKRLRSAGAAGEHGDGAAEIRSAMPGKVVRVLLEPGAAVDKGDGVVVVEAMKMQNELKAPKAGVVKDIRVTEGSTVSAGEVLAVIE